MCKVGSPAVLADAVFRFLYLIRSSLYFDTVLSFLSFIAAHFDFDDHARTQLRTSLMHHYEQRAIIEWQALNKHEQIIATI
jgi:hypothetical protein